MKRLLVFTLLFLAACGQSTAHGTPPPTISAAYIPTLAYLVSNSDVIAVVTVQSAVPDANDPAYDTTVQVNQAVKGPTTQLTLQQFDETYPLVEGDQELLFAYAFHTNGVFGEYASQMAERFLIRNRLIAPTWAVGQGFADPSLVASLNAGTCTLDQFLSAIQSA